LDIKDYSRWPGQKRIGQADRILGATLLCVEGDETVHSLLDARAAGVSCAVRRRCMHSHPTVSETFRRCWMG
jgi:pyruvate/2-oxoglutarate dehydrogenase complex dihydrolipoamide dehydrogenase (E3) component